ncbi:SDR family NAD(P)-dependent oxidoreductase [Pseudohoeflea coraliihabitans]|uniref:SDR family oxidoreductase n=1 Tax=Pseudohoeflea coraliihabitans TaxID=2860393 RepID=A0ABS6WT89_9HYPH|nr:SDR family oxidoreductase [Pseudohoeflea sp. DP4N28-3]MBW3099184.1 SDR family oxidoreductase [Pseudohoeflea sp. DP4N28-3]
MQQFRLDGQVALVTGAAGGLGAAQVRALLAAGARVLATDMAGEGLERTFAGDLQAGAALRLAQLDVTRDADLAATVDSCVQNDGSLDILVNNAGISRPGPVLDYDSGDFALTIEVNFRSVFRLSQLAGRAMAAQGKGGSIVNIASIGGMVVDGPTSSAYDGSKAAVIQITKNFAVELAEHGIRVNAVAPGYIRTEMTQRYLTDAAYMTNLMANKIPLKRVGEPSEIAGAVVFLASPAASYVTGHTLNVDGGWVIW